MPKRPHGFMKFIRREGFHSLLLVMDDASGKVSLHKANDPKPKLFGFKKSGLSTRVWWLAGKHISSRVVKDFAGRFEDTCDDRGAYDLSSKIAEQTIDQIIESLNTWSASENDMVHLMDLFQRRKENRPAGIMMFLPGLTESPPLDNPAVLKHFEEGFMPHAA